MSRDEYKINEDALERRAKIKTPANRGKVALEPKYCKGCGLCVNACPTGTLQFHEAPSNKWGVEVVVDSPEYCIGCRQCEMQCPDFAIFAYRADENVEKVV